MQRLFVPTLGPTDWRRLLADPTVQWERKKSALEMAVHWEAARNTPRGLPPEIAAAFDAAPDLHGAQLLIGIPEHKVPFDGGGHPSQNDLWGLLRIADTIASLTVEAKAGERLDELVRDWLPRGGERSRKPVRLIELKKWLALGEQDVSQIRYQLLHRTASALKEASRLCATKAIMIIQSFDRAADEQSWRDFAAFVQLMGAHPIEGAVVRSSLSTLVPLYLGWVTTGPADMERLSAAV